MYDQVILYSRGLGKDITVRDTSSGPYTIPDPITIIDSLTYLYVWL